MAHFNDWDLRDADGYNEHRHLVEEAKLKKRKFVRQHGKPRKKPARKRKPKPKPVPTELKYIPKKDRAKRIALAAFTERDLRGELRRRSLKRRMERATPEQLAEWSEKRKATYALRRVLCKHDKYEPKIIKKGPNAGKFCCRSCDAIVDPRPSQEIEIVV